MSINRMYYGTKKIYSFLENGNQGGECNCEQEYQNGYNQGYQDGLANCTGGAGEECTLGTGSILLDASMAGRYELFASDDGYDGWSKFIVELESDYNAKVWDAQYIVDDVKNGGNGFIDSRCLIKGQITSIKEINTQYGNATYNIGDFQVYKGKDEYGNGFTDADRLQVGDYVVVEGVVSMYKDTVQFSAGSELEAIFRCEGGSSEGGSNPFAEIGWTSEDDTTVLGDAIAYAKEIYDNWDATSSDVSMRWRDNTRLMFFPNVDWSNIEYANIAFYGCKSLVGVPDIVAPKLWFATEVFNGCSALQKAPMIYTDKIDNFYRFFYECKNLRYVPQYNTSVATSVSEMFAHCMSLTSLPLYNFNNVGDIWSIFGWEDLYNLTDLGGFANLKIDWNDDGGLVKLPNLTYVSIMNVINNLYDFRANGDAETVRTLKIHSNTMALLSDEDKQIAINKGWMLTE